MVKQEIGDYKLELGVKEDTDLYYFEGGTHEYANRPLEKSVSARRIKATLEKLLRNHFVN